MIPIIRVYNQTLLVQLQSMEKQFYTYNQPLQLEAGGSLPSVDIAYHTYGTLNADKSNVIWICHALTANSEVFDWWASLCGDGKMYDPKKYFIISANILGSPYGSSSPLTTDPKTGKPYYSSFPQITIRDIVKILDLLKSHLEIGKINTLIGGSLGGYTAMEWAAANPDEFEKLLLISTCAKESAWGIAIHTAQRLAIETDPTWNNMVENAGAKGLKAARAIGMISYRNYEAFVKTQTDNEEKLDDFRASSYINYQGDKLVKRFNAYSYWLLTKTMDSHNIGRGRESVENALSKIKSKTLIIGVSSDRLCPVAEQKLLAKHIPNATYEEIDSPYGHDSFLIEGKMIRKILEKDF